MKKKHYSFDYGKDIMSLQTKLFKLQERVEQLEKRVDQIGQTTMWFESIGPAQPKIYLSGNNETTPPPTESELKEINKLLEQMSEKD